MKIKTLDNANYIVDNSPNLKWDGWSIVAQEDGDGYSSINGTYTKNGWKLEKRFECINGVWDIPDRYITHVQV
jgi:hypothetical protein